MSCELSFYHWRHSPEAGISLSAAPYRWAPIIASNFDTLFPPQRHFSYNDANLYKNLILQRTPKPNRHSRDILHAVYSAAVYFLYHDNPPTWAKVEPATLGALDKQQISHANQSAFFKRCEDNS
ncbi:hypothetical protein TNCV_3850381 [Trichonephila clavipes]|nr:hypothetical protein TNCV_3850381 [Trichonephila clavipes]